MNGMLDLLNSDTGKNLIEGMGKQLGINRSSAATAIGSVIPLILGGLRNNASSSQEADGILGAILNPQHNGSILDNIGNILGGSGIDSNVTQDGEKILGHIFGKEDKNVARAVSKSADIDFNQAMSITKSVAPFIMGYLGKKAMTNGVKDQGDLKGLLGDLLGGDSDVQREVASKLQGFENNNDTLDDIAGLITGHNKSTNGIANILTGLFS